MAVSSLNRDTRVPAQQHRDTEVVERSRRESESCQSPVSSGVALSTMARQLNVQQQNSLVKERMHHCAALLELERDLHWLLAVLRQHGHEPEQGVLVRLKQVPDQDGDLYSGTWLGPDLKFWQFTATVDRRSPSVTVESFEDATGQVAFTKYQLGTGRSFGQLAIEVLRERRGIQRFDPPDGTPSSLSA
jgi:hypothetical protein